jgi:hypothetical protein
MPYSDSVVGWLVVELECGRDEVAGYNWREALEDYCMEEPGAAQRAAQRLSLAKRTQPATILGTTTGCWAHVHVVESTVGGSQLHLH